MKNRISIHFFSIVCFVIFVGGCAVIARMQLDDQFGPASPENRVSAPTEVMTVKYRQDVKPILESRCIVCHGCYDSPCQLNLSAHEGIERGVNKDLVYNAGRLLAIEPTRLFVDGHSSAQWREKQFYPVLNERIQTKEANIKGSLIAQFLQLKQQHPLPTVTPLPSSFDFSLDRAQSCPRIEEFDAFATKNPLWGMPYGLPGLTEQEHDILMTWVEEGAVSEALPPLDVATRSRITQWETFLNGTTLKEQLVSRYLFEHLFLAHLYFDDLPTRQFFRLVRSTTPPGEAVNAIATRRPYDDPRVSRIYYRFQRVESTILTKTHMPYALNQQRLARYSTLFLEPTYKVEVLPSYEAEASANPFETFMQIPVKSRYQFLLEEAQFTLMNFIKGPVCRGQIALNVINEHFWIIFVNPNNSDLDLGAKFLEKEARHLRMPTEKQSNADVVSNWLKYSRLEKNYVSGKIEFIRQQLPTPEDLSLELIWDGDGHNDNAALTVFRHLNNGTVVKGFVGDEPKTLVLLGYPLLERIHYLLVAGYDIYGNIGHQLNARLYMDFLRMEGELNFLTLLPEEVRIKEWKHWYRKAGRKVEDFGAVYFNKMNRQTGIHYRTLQQKSELIRMLQERLSSVLPTSFDIEKVGNTYVRQQLERLSHLKGLPVSWLPQNALLSIDGADDPVVTLIHNNGLSNVSHLFFNNKRRLPEEDTVTVVRGIMGAYPNAFYHVAKTELDGFVSAVERLSSEEDYQALLSRYGVRRTDPDFWKHSDYLQKVYQDGAPIEAGLLDYNRLDNR